MKDKPLQSPIPTGSIPVISPILHCLALPVLVLLRHGFGYLFLSPKSIFLALVFAAALFSYAVWHDDGLKPRFFNLAVFGSISSIFYLFYLLLAVFKQGKGTAEHDNHSGTSNLLFLIPTSNRERFENLTHNAMEPAIVIAIGYFTSSNSLGKLLLCCGIALAFKEWIRAWLGIRLKKRVEDHMGDAKENLVIPEAGIGQPLSKTGRTEKEVYQRRVIAKQEELIDPESEFSKELRMMEPYTLEKAEENFAALVASVDPDSATALEQISRLNKAVEFFRGRKQG